MEKITPLIRKSDIKNKNLKKIKKLYLNFIKKQEVLGEPFFDKVGQLKKYYLPICDAIYKDYIKNNKTYVVGLSGSQGSGKTTIAQILKLILKSKYNLKVVNFSIDDFYKTLSERKKMSKNIHHLFKTRGVPGTHDTKFLLKIFKNLKNKKFRKLVIPQFDKSEDDRKIKKMWKKVKKRPHIIIFEGWCVGATHQTSEKLNKPINLLEKKYDKKLTWRKKVNTELKYKYKKIFNLIDKFIFLKVPNFKLVIKWRQLQETKLKLLSKGKKIMTKNEINNFIMYYERITKHMLKVSSLKANILINLDKKHRLSSIKF